MKEGRVLLVVTRQVLPDVLLQIHELHEVDVGYRWGAEDLTGQAGIGESLRELRRIPALIVIGRHSSESVLEEIERRSVRSFRSRARDSTRRVLHILPGGVLLFRCLSAECLEILLQANSGTCQLCLVFYYGWLVL